MNRRIKVLIRYSVFGKQCRSIYFCACWWHSAPKPPVENELSLILPKPLMRLLFRLSTWIPKSVKLCITEYHVREIFVVVAARLA